MNRQFDIVIPVYGAVESLRECLRALTEHTLSDHRFWIYDDCTPERSVERLIEQWRERDRRFRYRRNERRLGYVRNVNRAIADTDRDLVLLNSDATVTPGWLERISSCMDADAHIGVVSPLSDNATLLTVTHDRRCPSERVAAAASDPAIDIPVAVGFCMAIRRRLMEAIGDFDPAFSPGYGEESDFCMRARQRGFRVVACTEAFVVHRGRDSFGHGEEIGRLRLAHEHLLAQRWPGYESAVRTWWRDNPLRGQIERLARGNRQRPLIAHLLHRYHSLGGTEGITRQLVEKLSDEFDHLIIVPDETPAGWADARPLMPRPGVRVLAFNPAYLERGPTLLGNPAGLADAWLDRWLKNVLASSGAELVHIHHLFGWGTLMPASIAVSLGLPVVASLHDFHFMCPAYNQIGLDGRPCGKPLVTPEPDCVRCLAARGGNREESLPGYVLRRRALIRQAVQDIRAFIVPSEYLRTRFGRAFGNRAAARCHVMPHGVAPPSASGCMNASSSLPRLRGRAGEGAFAKSARPLPDPLPRPGKDGNPTLSVVYVGGLKELKGCRVLVEAARRLKPGTHINIHFYGAVGDAGDSLVELPGHCLWHGPFAQGDAASVMRDADIIVVPSLFEETFSLVASEAWACGKPVLSSRIGALANRVKDGENGWLFPPGDSVALSEKLQWLASAEGRRALALVTANVGRKNVRDVAAAAAPYRKLYRDLLTGPLRRPEPRARESGEWKPELPSRAESNLPLWEPPEPSRAEGSGIAIWARGTSGTDRMRALSELAKSDGVGPVFLDNEPLPWHKTADVDWLWILEPDEVPRPGALPALRCVLREQHRARAVCMDHLHIDRGGNEYGRVYKSAWDPWMAATTPDFDCGWVLRPAFARTLFEGGKNGVPVVEQVLRKGAFESGIAVAGLPASARSDLSLDDAGARMNPKMQLLAPESPGMPTLDIWVIDHGDAAGLFSTLADLADRNDKAVLGTITIFTDTAIRHAEGWPEDWNWRGRNSLAPAASNEGVLLLQAGVEVHHSGRVASHLKYIGRNDVKAVGFCVRGALGGVRPAGRVLGHPARALLATRQWPGGADGGRVLRKHTALTFETALVRARDFRDQPPALVLAESAGASEFFRRDGGVLLASSAPAFVSRHRPYFSTPDAVNDSARRDPYHAPQLSLRHTDIREDGVSRDYSALPGGGPQVFAIAADEWASSAYRLSLPLAQLCGAGKIRPPVVQVAARDSMPRIPEVLRVAPDTVLLQHTRHADAPELLAGLSGNARRIYLLDDLVTELPKGHPHARRTSEPTSGRLMESLANADLLIVSTRALAERFDSCPCPVRVIENALPHDPWMNFAARRTSPRGDARLRLGWAGAQQHEADLRILKPVVQATHREVDWVFFGMCPDYLRPFASAVLPPVTFDQYPRALSEMDIDAAVAPLTDNAFNRCKSALKLLEFGALGIPVIASDLPPYQGAPVTRVDNTPGAWIAAIRAYLENRCAARADGHELRRWVVDRHLLSHRIDQWMDAIQP